jgi:hypothetical protein
VPIIECARCGYEWEVASIRKAENFCTSCRAKPVKTVDKDGDKCIPWRGRFDVDLITPIDDNGVEVKPGPRTCGARDCMNNRHIMKGSQND